MWPEICSISITILLLSLLVVVIMGSGMSNVPTADLDNWAPAPWPQEHHDEEGKVTPFLEDGRFANPWMKDRPSVLSFFATWFFGDDDSNIPGKAQLSETLPVKTPAWVNDSNVSYVAGDARVTWLGHASVLAEVDGLTILTDPIFSDRASAVQFAGPKRYTRPPCKVKELPAISAVVISHSHYDHLDLNTVSSLAKLQPNINWFVPMGMAQWFLDNTVVTKEKVKEMTWWQEEPLMGSQLKMVFTPSNHWCKRTVGDDNKMLWGSWAVLGPKTRFWFGGDTGYCEAFKQIGDKYGPFDLAAIPIGAYQPNWFMKYQHVHPGNDNIFILNKNIFLI